MNPDEKALLREAKEFFGELPPSGCACRRR
jgi:hypothetical protein